VLLPNRLELPLCSWANAREGQGSNLHDKPPSPGNSTVANFSRLEGTLGSPVLGYEQDQPHRTAQPHLASDFRKVSLNGLTEMDSWLWAGRKVDLQSIVRSFGKENLGKGLENIAGRWGRKARGGVVDAKHINADQPGRTLRETGGRKPQTPPERILTDTRGSDATRSSHNGNSPLNDANLEKVGLSNAFRVLNRVAGGRERYRFLRGLEWLCSVVFENKVQVVHRMGQALWFARNGTGNFVDDDLDLWLIYDDAETTRGWANPYDFLFDLQMAVSFKEKDFSIWKDLIWSTIKRRMGDRESGQRRVLPVSDAPKFTEIPADPKIPGTVDQKVLKTAMQRTKDGMRYFEETLGSSNAQHSGSETSPFRGGRVGI